MSRSPRGFYARRDFTCPADGAILRDVFLRYGQYPACPACGGQMDWIPAIGRMDAYEPFQEFSVHHRGRDVEIDSLSKLRKVERESEAMARDQAGQQLVWRDYSQDRSNRDQHTLTRGRLDRPIEGWGGAEPDGSKFRSGTQSGPEE